MVLASFALYLRMSACQGFTVPLSHTQISSATCARAHSSTTDEGHSWAQAGASHVQALLSAGALPTAQVHAPDSYVCNCA